MMPEGNYTISILFETVPEGVTETIVNRCREMGLYDPEKNNSAPRSSTPKEIDEEGAGNVRLRSRDIEFELSFDLKGLPGHWNGKSLMISVEARLFDYAEKNKKDLKLFVRSIEKLTKELSIIVDAAFVTSHPSLVTDEYMLGIYPEAQPIAENISNIPWLGIYNPETVEALGGVDRFMNAPAHRVEQLETGHVMVVATEDPFAVPDRELEKYLLENEGE